MKNAHLGSLDVSRIGLGAMTMAGTYTTEGALDDSESIRTIRRALDLALLTRRPPNTRLCRHRPVDRRGGRILRGGRGGGGQHRGDGECKRHQGRP